MNIWTFRWGGTDYALLAVASPRDPRDRVLTGAERDVVRGVLAGWSNARIARERNSSPRTVANQLAAIYRKLGISSRRELGAPTSAVGGAVVGLCSATADARRPSPEYSPAGPRTEESEARDPGAGPAPGGGVPG